MFVRFRQSHHRLQVSVLGTRRVAGKVTSEHVGSLGSVAVPTTVAGRLAFWENLWERLTALSNRISADDQTKIRNAVHARIQMVLPDEANADEAAYWEKYSAVFAERGVREREDAARAYAEAIDSAEMDESFSAVFAENRAAALKGQRLEGKRMDRMLVGELLAPGCLEPPADGTPIIMANGEPGIYRAAKRPFRNDRRRRRGGFRLTRKRPKSWQLSRLMMTLRNSHRRSPAAGKEPALVKRCCEMSHIHLSTKCTLHDGWRHERRSVLSSISARVLCPCRVRTLAKLILRGTRHLTGRDRVLQRGHGRGGDCAMRELMRSASSASEFEPTAGEF
jgi:hypothetical protein